MQGLMQEIISEFERFHVSDKTVCGEIYAGNLAELPESGGGGMEWGRLTPDQPPIPCSLSDLSKVMEDFEQDLPLVFPSLLISHHVPSCTDFQGPGRPPPPAIFGDALWVTCLTLRLQRAFHFLIVTERFLHPSVLEASSWSLALTDCCCFSNKLSSRCSFSKASGRFASFSGCAVWHYWSSHFLASSSAPSCSSVKQPHSLVRIFHRMWWTLLSASPVSHWKFTFQHLNVLQQDFFCHFVLNVVLHILPWYSPKFAIIQQIEILCALMVMCGRPAAKRIHFEGIPLIASCVTL